MVAPAVRILRSLKDTSLFWLVHCGLIISEAVLVAHHPVGKILQAQIAVLAISSLWYILLILSYVDQDALIKEKVIRVKAKHRSSDEYRTGIVKSFHPNHASSDIDECVVLFDDDGDELTIPEQNLKIIHPSRGFVVQMMHGIYSKFINPRQNRRMHIIDLNSELTMLSIEFESGKEENRLERYAIIFGWLLLATGYSGIAALRAFRVFRILWYYKVTVLQNYLNFNFEHIVFGAEKIDNYESTLFIAMKLMVQNLESLGKEMFTITGRGGLLLMLIFFYSAFVFGAAYWIETGADVFDSGQTNWCSDLSVCVYTMMRLTFYDGNGFDYAQNIMHSHRELFVLLMIYLCITAFGMLNGLIGIFGDSFLRNIVAADDANSATGRVNQMNVESKLHDIMHLLSEQGSKIDELSAVVEQLNTDEKLSNYTSKNSEQLLRNRNTDPSNITAQQQHHHHHRSSLI